MGYDTTSLNVTNETSNFIVEPETPGRKRANSMDLPVREVWRYGHENYLQAQNLNKKGKAIINYSILLFIYAGNTQI